MLVNLTQQNIHIFGDAGQTTTLPKCDEPIWCDLQETVLTHEFLGDMAVPVVEVEALNFDNLPEPEEGVYYIVPKNVAISAWDRHDLVYSAGIVSDENRHLMGCRKFRLP